MLRILTTLAVLALLAPPVTVTATAAGPYTPDTLSALLLTPNQLARELKATGSKLTFDGTSDLAATNDPVGVGRVFTSAEGTLTMTLFSLPDGSAPEGRLRDGVLNGDFTRATADAMFTSITEYAMEPSRWGDGLDMLATFKGSAGGAQYNVMGCSFIRGDVFGLIVFATTGVNDNTVMSSAFVGQLNRLP